MALGYNWQRALQGLSQGLMQAGGPQGWSAFGPGMIQGQQYYDQQQQQKTMDEMRQLQAQALQQELEQQRTANTEKAAREKAINDLLGGGLMAPNGLSQAKFGGAPIQPGMMSGAFDPRQAAFLKAVGPDVAAPIIGEQLFSEQKELKPIEIGGVLIDPTTYKPVADYSDVLRRNAAAGKQNISITNMPPSLDKKGESEFVLGTLQDMQKKADAAAQSMANLSQVKSSLDNGLQTGIFASPREYLAKTMQALGSDQATTDSIFKLTDAKLFTSAASDMVLGQIKQLGSNPTDTDRKFIQEMMPKVTDTPEAARAVADWMSDKYQDAMDRYQMSYDTYSSGKDIIKFDAKMKKYWAIPRKARELLHANPSMKADFDAKYGAGSADLILGVQ